MQFEDLLDPVANRSDVGFLFTEFIENQAIPLRPMDVDHPPLDGFDQDWEVIRKVSELG